MWLTYLIRKRRLFSSTSKCEQGIIRYRVAGQVYARRTSAMSVPRRKKMKKSLFIILICLLFCITNGYSSQIEKDFDKLINFKSENEYQVLEKDFSLFQEIIKTGKTSNQFLFKKLYSTKETNWTLGSPFTTRKLNEGIIAAMLLNEINLKKDDDNEFLKLIPEKFHKDFKEQGAIVWYDYFLNPSTTYDAIIRIKKLFGDKYLINANMDSLAEIIGLKTIKLEEIPVEDIFHYYQYSDDEDMTMQIERTGQNLQEFKIQDFVIRVSNNYGCESGKFLCDEIGIFDKVFTFEEKISYFFEQSWYIYKNEYLICCGCDGNAHSFTIIVFDIRNKEKPNIFTIHTFGFEGGLCVGNYKNKFPVFLICKQNRERCSDPNPGYISELFQLTDKGFEKIDGSNTIKSGFNWDKWNYEYLDFITIKK